MTKKELRESLARLPDDAEVRLMSKPRVVVSGRMYHGATWRLSRRATMEGGIFHLILGDAIPCVPAARLAETMTWSRMPDGMECSRPCPETIALRVYESGCDMVPPNCPEFDMHEAAIKVLDKYLGDALGRPAKADADTPKPPVTGQFVIVNGWGRFLTVLGGSTDSMIEAVRSRNERLAVRRFPTRAEAAAEVLGLSSGIFTVVELEPKQETANEN